MARYNRRDTWRLWKGTPADVVEIARVASDAISELSSDAGPVTIKVTMPGVEDEFEPVEFEEAVSQYGSRRIHEVSIWAWATNGHVNVGFDRGGPHGVTAGVQGTNRRWVDGTWAQVVDAVSNRSRRPQRIWPLFVLGVLTAGFGEVLLLVADHAWEVAIGLLLVFGGLGLLLTNLGSLSWFFPRSDLAVDASQSRRHKAVQLALKGVGVVLTLAIGAVLYALAQRLLT